MLFAHAIVPQSAVISIAIHLWNEYFRRFSPRNNPGDELASFAPPAPPSYAVFAG
jgi:hypothetical protein